MKIPQTDGKSLSEVHGSIDVAKKAGKWKKFLAFIGPAYLVSVGYMDPGNWATDIAGGSQFGYSLIWVLLMSNLMALLLQSLSARLGVVQGMDLAQASRANYPPFVNIPLYILAEIAIAACDLAEIIGMAIGLQLLFGIPLIWGVTITVFDTLILLLLMNRGIRIMELFIVSMVFIIGLSFLVEMFITKPEITDIMGGFVPEMLSGNALYIAIGIIGATVMPHNLYLHSSLVQTRKIERTPKGIWQALKYNFIDTAIALNLAFFVNAAILILAATAFFKNGLFNIAEIQDAHMMLENIFGKLAPALFAIALIAAGQSSTITGTLAGQIVMEGYLNLRIRPWLRRLITRLIAITPAYFTILYFGEEKLGALLILSQVVLSLQLGFAVIPLIHFNSDKQKMKEFTIKNWMKILAWSIAIIIVSLNAQLVIEEISGWLKESPQTSIYIITIVIPITILVAALLAYITFAPLIKKYQATKKMIPHGKAVELNEFEPVVYNKIALTIDFSEKDKSTVRYAIFQGGKKAEYVLIHIVETAGAQYIGENILDLETRTDEKNIQKYADDLKVLGYKVEVKIGYGNPAKAIATIVKESNAELLVMGSHGHKGIKDVIFGATVDSVRHNVNIPVLIV